MVEPEPNYPDWLPGLRRDIRSLAYSLMVLNDSVAKLLAREANARAIEESHARLRDDRVSLSEVVRRNTVDGEGDTWPAPEGE